MSIERDTSYDDLSQVLSPAEMEDATYREEIAPFRNKVKRLHSALNEYFEGRQVTIVRVVQAGEVNLDLTISSSGFGAYDVLVVKPSKEQSEFPNIAHLNLTVDGLLRVIREGDWLRYPMQPLQPYESRGLGDSEPTMRVRKWLDPFLDVLIESIES